MWLGFACGAVLFALVGRAFAQDSVALVERLRRAIALNSIDDADMKPWHLKLSFQLFDDKGTPTEKGTIEEWWAGPSMHKTIYVGPSYTSTEIETKDGFYRTKGAERTPRLVEYILDQVVHPMPRDSDISSALPIFDEHHFGKTKMDCIMLARSKAREFSLAHFGIAPTYCFDQGKDLLRLSYAFISQAALRTRIGLFQGHEVVVDQIITLASANEATAHLDALESIPAMEPDFNPSSDLEKIPNHKGLLSVVSAGSTLTSVPPVYPEGARSRRVSGIVVLSAVIGEDGRIHSLKALSSPEEDFTKAALTAVQQWTYKPYLVDGKPVEVDTVVTVNFEIAH
jgi:TonB family protein